MLVEQLFVLFIVSSFAYLIGVLIGRASDKEIRKSVEKFKKFDYYVYMVFMFVAVIMSIYLTWHAVIGVLFAYLIIINAKKKIERFTVLPLILGLSAAFVNDIFIILLSLGTFYILIFGMIMHKDNHLKIVIRSQVRYVILALIVLFVPVLTYTVFNLGTYQLDISAILVTFLASMIIVGTHENFFRRKSISKLE